MYLKIFFYSWKKMSIIPSTYTLFNNLLSLTEKSTFSKYRTPGLIVVPHGSLLSNTISEFLTIYIDYGDHLIDEQTVIDRLENIKKTIIDSKTDNIDLVYFKMDLELIIPMFKCFLLSSSSN